MSVSIESQMKQGQLVFIASTPNWFAEFPSWPMCETYLRAIGETGVWKGAPEARPESTILSQWEEPQA